MAPFFFSLRATIGLLLIFVATQQRHVTSFSLLRHRSVIISHQAHREGITIQYSPTSLKHLEAIELPDDHSRRPWTSDKVQAVVGALIVGSVAAAIGEYAVQALFGEEKAFFLFGAVGAAAGWFLFGGDKVRQQELPMNGGYDAKLVADRPSRLRNMLSDVQESTTISVREKEERDLTKVMPYIRAVHGDDYVRLLETASRETDRPKRFNPLFPRTLMDQSTFDAAVNAVADWLDSVDAALAEEETPLFVLVRPPGHHSCRSKAMGGCFLCSAAIAAMYALDQPGVDNVAILDIDAHFGNGIAHCVQEEPRIRYCSIHEHKSQFHIIEKSTRDDDPRSPDDSDHSPLGNICNINLPAQTGWDSGYRDALVDTALPFLLQDEPSVLLVAAGFDALQADWSSGLSLKPMDYEQLASELRSRFGNRVASGLEGGYCTNGDLSRALLEFVKPWQES